MTNYSNQIKKWMRILFGKSIDHVNQPMGSQFVPGEIKGYFNDLTGKVLYQKKMLETNELPKVNDEKGQKVIFPVAIIQYGLGAYDLFLQSNEKKYLVKFMQCVDWVELHTNEDGSIDNFSCFNMPPFGSMCQGEAISLFSRAYVQTHDKRYIEKARKMYNYMITPVEQGGVSVYRNNNICFLECTNHPAILNGWVFSIFGIYDILLLTNEVEYKLMLDKAISSLANLMYLFDNNIWSFYDLDKNMASPFYHRLHVAQLQALMQITTNDVFNTFYMKFRRRSNNPLFLIIAVFIKIYQKIFRGKK